MSSDIIFALYVSACYWAVIVIGEVVDEKCYARLHEKGSPVEAIIKIKKKGAKVSASGDIQILRCGPTRYSSKLTSKIALILPGVGLFILILLLRMTLEVGKTRGSLILFLFAAVCILINMITSYTKGLGFIPSTSVLMVGFFYGALFWFIDSFCNKERFDSLIASVMCSSTTIEKIEKLKLLYGATKDNLTLVSTLFLGVCIAMVFNISNTIKEQYTEGGLSYILTGWSIWLTFWGSIGLLGWIGSELGRQITLIMNALK